MALAEGKDISHSVAIASLVFIVFGTFGTSASGANVMSIFQNPRVTVVIWNALPGGATFTIHCKSGDDDLGTHVITSNDKYQFSFRPRVVGMTLFFCGVSWSGGHVVFDAYTVPRDVNRCRKECKWVVTQAEIIGYPYPFVQIGYQPN